MCQYQAVYVFINFWWFFLLLFLRRNGRSTVNDASIPAGSCWKHERHDEFQQHVTTNQQVALNHKT